MRMRFLRVLESDNSRVIPSVNPQPLPRIDKVGVPDPIDLHQPLICRTKPFWAVKSLGEEFDLKTATFVFTSRSSRIQIIIAKIVSVTIVNMLSGRTETLFFSVFLSVPAS